MPLAFKPYGFSPLSGHRTFVVGVQKRLSIGMALAAALLLMACTDNSGQISGEAVHRRVTLTLTPGCWTYFNMAENRVVGTAAIGDSQADAVWAQRKDWDIAFSEQGLRTNGGTSGGGRGGLLALPEGWDVQTALPAEGYVADDDSTQVFVPLRSLP